MAAPSAIKAQRPPRFIPGVVRLRWLVISLWVVLIVASASVYLSKFQIDNSVSIWFLEDDPELASYHESLEAFGEKEWTYLWLRTESVFAGPFLRDLRELKDKLLQVKHVHQVITITDASGFQLNASGTIGEIIFYSAALGSQPNSDQIAVFREGLKGRSLVGEGLLAGDDETYTVVAIQNDNLVRETRPYRIGLVDQIRELVVTYDSMEEFGIVGTTVVNAELNRAARRDMFVFYGLISAFVALVGGLVMSYRSDLVVLIAVVVATVIPVLGLVSALGFSFNLITVMLPTLLVTVSVSYLIHFLSVFHLERAAVSTSSQALSLTFGRLLKPGFWTSITTMIGFLSLTLSGVAPIRHVGWFAAVGIVLAWIATLTLAPALLSLLWGKPGHGAPSAESKSRGSYVLLMMVRRHPWLAAIFAIAVMTSGFGLSRLRTDTNYVEFFRPGNQVRSDYAQLSALDLPQSSLDVVIAFPEGKGFADRERHRQIREFEEQLLALPEINRVESLDRFVEQVGQSLGVQEGAAEQQLGALLTWVTSEEAPQAREFLSRDGRRLRLRLMTDYLSTSRIEVLRGKLESVTASTLPAGWTATVTGTNLLWANMDAQVVRTQLLSIGITSAFVLVILPLVFRSLLLGLLGFLVSFLPIACTLGILGWSGIPVNIATCLLGGVVIGLSVDDTIYFVSRIRESLDKGCSIATSVKRAIWSTGRAMVKTSAVLVGGFLTMAASDFMPSVYFGLFFAASIIIALLADLLLLPALLRICAHWFEGRRPSR